MKVTVEQLPQRQVVLNIEADPREYEEGKRHAYQHILERTRVPGFRNGKAPMAMVERYTGKAAFLEETIQHLVPEITEKAIGDQKLDIVGTPNIEMVTTEPVTWKAKVDLVPEVDLRAYQEIRIPEEAIEATDEEVDASLEELRRGLAPWEPVQRPAQLGDLVILDMTAEYNGRVMGQDKDAQYELVGGRDSPALGFPEELVGIPSGGVKEFDLTYSAQDSRREVAGKMVHFSVTIKDVKGKAIPALDDEFARSVSEGFDDLAALKRQVTEQVLASKRREGRATLEERAAQALIDGSQMSYSPGMVAHEALHILEDQDEQLRQNRVTMDDYLRAMNKSREDLLEEFRPVAEQRLRRSLALVELRKREDLQVADEEVEQEIERLATGVSDPAALHRAFRSEAAQASLKGSLLTRKTLNRLVEIVAPGNKENEEGTTRADKP